MGLTLKMVGTSGGVGALDICAGWFDGKQGYTKSFQNTQDIGRSVYVVGGYLAGEYGFVGEEIADSAVLAGIPLLEHSIYELVKDMTAPTVPRKPGKQNPKIGLRLKETGQQQRPRGGSSVRYV